MHSFRSFDGTEIEYTSTGEGPSALVLINGLGCVASYWKYTIAHFQPHMRIITYDLRGHGNSDHPAHEDHVEIEHHARDLVGLVDHLGLERPVLAGFSLGVQIMFESYRLAGTRLGGLVAVTGPYRNPLATFYGMKMPDKAIRGIFGAFGLAEKPLSILWPLIFGSPRIVYPLSIAIGAANARLEDMEEYFEHMKTMNAPMFLRFAAAAARHSAEDVLRGIRIPTLIIGAERDTFTPVALSEHMAATIPEAEYLFLRGGTHTSIVERPNRINRTMERFLRERLPDHLRTKLPI
jgi:3-oxoadipate enol-lactonase